MKIRILRTFRYIVDGKLRTLEPGEHDLDPELANKALKWGKARVVEKKAPENKHRGKAPENKTGVGTKTKRGRRTRAKSDP